MKKIIILFIFLFTAFQLNAASITSGGTGNWSATAWPNTTRTGTITTSNSSTAVTGSGSSFTTEISVGNIIKNSSNTTIGTVASITDNTHLTFTGNAASTNTSIAYKSQGVGSVDDVTLVAGTVTVDGSSTYACNSITIQVNAKLDWSTNTATLNCSGNVNLSGASGQQISCGPGQFKCGSIINGSSGCPISCTTGSIICAGISVGSGSAISCTSGSITTSTNGGVTFGNITVSSSSNITCGTGTIDCANISSGSTVFCGNGTITCHGNLTATTISFNSTAGTITCNDFTTNSGGSLTFGTSTGILNIGGLLTWASGSTLTAGSGTFNFNGSAQTVPALSSAYFKLTLSGSGIVTTAGITVNNIFSIEGTITSVSAAPTYGAAATLQYNRLLANPLTSGVEWKSTFASIAGVKIAGAGTITLNGSKDLTLVPLTINNGASLDCGSTNVISGTGSFTLSSGGTIITSNTGGLVSSITTSGTNTFTAGANYTFNGATTTPFHSATLGNPNNIKIGANVTINKFTTVTGNLNLSGGKLTLGPDSLTIGTSGSISSSSSNYVVTNGTGYLIQNVPTSGTTTYPIGTSTTYNPVILNSSSTATAQNFYVRVTTSFTPSLTTPASCLNKGWVIRSSLSNGVAIKATFQWTSGVGDEGTNITSGNRSTLAIGVQGGGASPSILAGAYDILPSTVTPGTPNTIVNNNFLLSNATFDLSNYPNGRLFVVGLPGAMPVELSTFTSNSNGRTILLNWETKTEKNSNKFEIDRSLQNENNWASIGSIKAAVLSNSPKQYSFTDKNLQPGKYQYRLKMIDNDGSFEYSKVAEAEITLPKDFDLSQNYPNPFNPTTKINYNLPNDSKVTLEVFNLIGEKVAQLVNEQQSAGYYTVNFGKSSNSISSGIYIYKLTAADNTGKNFSSVKKMMLLK